MHMQYIYNRLELLFFILRNLYASGFVFLWRSIVTATHIHARAMQSQPINLGLRLSSIPNTQYPYVQHTQAHMNGRIAA